MSKILKSIKLTRAVVDDIERRQRDEDFNLSQWIDDTYTKLEMGEKYHKKKQREHELMAKKHRNMAEYSAKNRLNIRKNLSEEQVFRRQIAKKILRKNISFLDGQLRAWNNDFKMKLSKKDFLEMIEIE